MTRYANLAVHGRQNPGAAGMWADQIWHVEHNGRREPGHYLSLRHALQRAVQLYAQDHRGEDTRWLDVLAMAGTGADAAVIGQARSLAGAIARVTRHVGMTPPPGHHG